MWIKTLVLVGCVAAALASEEQRPKKKEEARGKRNLQYSIAHNYNPHSYRLERRISTAPQIPYQTQFFPGPRSHSPYHKGRPRSLPAPPYAVQMEPLVHYSQRDPLYNTNTLSLNTDGHDDLLPDNNHLSEHVYGPQKHIVERPVYIKDPEPIIEIIIKESNVTLPPLPTPPPLAPKKKEPVQVFYVKYKKNPNGHGKDSIIYDKPIPAISPPVRDEHDEQPPQEYHHHEVVSSPPPPSTTLRTIIRPDSETYHSPSGVKVTFGKEGFDYEKRSNKPEDLKAAPGDHRTVQFPQGRQLSSFPPSPPRRPSTFSFPANLRHPQPYRPFNQFRQTTQNYPPPGPQQYSTLPKFAPFSQPPKTNQQFPPPRPAPPQFQQRQPVPYQPFDSFRQPPVQFKHQTHFPISQPPVTQKPNSFNQFGQLSQAEPPSKPLQQQKPTFDSFRQERPQAVSHQQQQSTFSTFPQQLNHPQLQQPSPNQHFPQFNQQPNIIPPGGELVQSVPRFEQHISVEEPTKPQQQPVHQSQQVQYQSQPQIRHQSQQSVQHQPQQTQQIQHQTQQHIQHQSQQTIQYQPQQTQHQPQQIQHQPQQIQHQPQQIQRQPQQIQHQLQQSIEHQAQQIQHQPQQLIQHQSQQQIQQQPKQQPQYQPQPHPQPQYQPQPSPQPSITNHNNVQQQFRDANALQDSIRQSSPSFFNLQQSQQLNVYQTSPNPNIYSTTARPTTTTTTTTTEKPSTTTKDPKVLNAQLPDEVPEDLRQQLLSSGILNHADISILDYDKVGDIPLSALPPDQLANFFNAGGAQQIQAAGSEPEPAISNRDFDEEASEIHEVMAKPEVQMKVVHYDPESEKGKQVQEAYVNDDATQLDPVVLNDEKYNRYLPLKVSGAQFPIPDVPELKGKKVSSVVVLAPVAYDFSSSRQTRDVKEDIELLDGTFLKDLLNNPTQENFKKFLEKENQTSSDKQAVILLVTGASEDVKEKEIFMYDVATQTVSKLDGELSSAFVEAAEANSFEDKEVKEASASEIVETRIPYDLPVIDPQGDLETEASEHLESFVDVSVDDDLTASESHAMRETETST